MIYIGCIGIRVVGMNCESIVFLSFRDSFSLPYILIFVFGTGKFGNIFYVTVSRTANFQVIVQKIIEHTGCHLQSEFQSDEDAKNQLESRLKRIGSGRILLVLDDVWSKSESLIQKFMFRIPGYKVLVTSRFMFPGPHYTYELNMLNDEDATSLFCDAALAHNVPSDLLKEVIPKMNKNEL